MKVGITINDYYKDYLEEIAILNNLSLTSICGLIVENFLSFNKRNKRFPIFQRQVNIVFAHEKDNKGDIINHIDSCCSGSVDPACKPLSKEEILKQLKESQLQDIDLHDNYLDEDELPF